ncbi:MAG: dephospho-CoA kinase [Gemmatimonadetes bacterium]|mgnify:CR=1 FL=1|nr:dephospho-CoA kinase [Gemmatimonadota bacterium]MBT6145080.1 dephospho-CoA kinase [Gemmatimonadota bacterium]MBT7863397.1 dephospho-CoA kinase [Gemmatimonadota bacterium]
MRVAITGNMGSGKSSLATRLGQWGAAVVDADRCARELLETHESVRQVLAAAFGRDVLDENGLMRRGLLAERAFSDEASCKLLDRLIREPLEKLLWSSIDEAASEHEIVILDAPLLFEWGIEDRFDVVIVVTSSVPRAMERLQERGIDVEQAARRRAQQWPASRQIQHADFVVNNDGPLSHLDEEAREIWRRLGTLDGRKDGSD